MCLKPDSPYGVEGKDEKGVEVGGGPEAGPAHPPPHQAPVPVHTTCIFIVLRGR
jgi:hypothetical protein